MVTPDRQLVGPMGDRWSALTNYSVRTRIGVRSPAHRIWDDLTFEFSCAVVCWFKRTNTDGRRQRALDELIPAEHRLAFSPRHMISHNCGQLKQAADPTSDGALQPLTRLASEVAFRHGLETVGFVAKQDLAWREPSEFAQREVDGVSTRFTI